jgi:hypothetical protein
MNARRLKASAVFVTMLLCNTMFTAWVLSGNALGVAGAASTLNQSAIGPAATTIPTAFSYQGTLRDANGNLINGTVNLSLRLYGVVTGGNPLYSENFANVNVRSGLFTVIVGDAQVLPASVFNTFPLYIGIQVNNDAEMLPRQRMHPVPYAMQSSSAQNAVTADNLAQGGGVPGSVSFGAGGAKAINFPDGGKITDSANGMTLSGGGANKTVTVEGGWSAGAILDQGDSNSGPNQRSTYPVSMNRYVVEAPDNGTSPDTVPIDDAILTDYCADADGCSVSLYMRNWDGTRPGQLAGVSGYRMTLGASVNGKRQWSIHSPLSQGVVGTDNNGAIEHLLSIYSSCFLTDGEYLNGQGNGDNQPGFGLLNWYRTDGYYNLPSMTCVLIIED